MLAADAAGSSHLVDLVDEDDAARLDALERLPDDGFVVDQLLRLLLLEDAPRLGNAQLALLGLLSEWEAAEHLLQVDAHLFHALRAEDLHVALRALLHVQLDHAIVEPARAQHPAQLFARAAAVVRETGGTRLRAHRQKEIEESILRHLLCAALHGALLLVAYELHALLHQVANHRVDVAADVAHLGELRGLDLHERRVGEPGQPARNLRLADAGRSHQDDVLRHHFVAQLRRHAETAPAVAQRDRHRALGGILADDVPVQLGDDFAGSEGAGLRHQSSSNVSWSLV